MLDIRPKSTDHHDDDDSPKDDDGDTHVSRHDDLTHSKLFLKKKKREFFVKSLSIFFSPENDTKSFVKRNGKMRLQKKYMAAS